MSCLVDFSMSPIDKGESVSQYVARILDVVDNSGIPYKLHAMGTTLEGDFDTCIKVISDCYECMSQDCQRISCSIKIDSRVGQTDRLSGKISSIEAHLDRKLQT